ncbi:MAG: mannose-1-phosphate guanylyltransferase [Planctomycetia bacterium]|nr:mannose-1-phosphate guanylyltransferase [Planctomycetia bacterium]
MLHAVIMAGGAGTRFWPASRADRPKQLLRLSGERTMLQATVDRLAGLVPADRTSVLTNERLLGAVRDQLPNLPASAILGEPARRDTAPCIGLAALLVRRDDPDATMLVMPADHLIEPTEKFQAAVGQAVGLIDAAPRRIVTFGIQPTYPAEIFGYIERGTPLGASALERVSPKTETAAPAYSVKQFREKPKADVAREYLASGNFYWNSGIFLWRAATIVDELTARQPKMMQHLEKIAAARPADFQDVFRREFEPIQGVSIDYAVMEHATDVAVIEAPFTWDDVGNWPALARVHGTDADGNTIQARHLGVRTSGSIIYSEKRAGDKEHLITTLGLDNVIVVHTPDATLVANRDDEEAVRELVRKLQELGWTEYL